MPRPHEHDPALRLLEAEAITILRETVAQFERPVLMYSIGKDSAVLLHLARKAFHPGPVPFPLLHIDTTWKFREMIALRDRTAKELSLDLRVYTNTSGLEAGLHPERDGEHYTTVMKTEALRQALVEGQFDAAIGGARRDEEKSRAKERIFSHRNRNHRWDSKNQRPELWSIYNGRVKPGETMRVFPLSNWTELDVWRYISAEDIPIVPLYFAAERPVVERNGQLIMVDDDRLSIAPDEQVSATKIRFRTLGCYPLTSAVRSDAETIDEIIDEITRAPTSERAGRLIDQDSEGAMEKKKLEGYF